MRRQIDGFLHYLETEKDCSDNTISAYQNDLTQFLEFAQGTVSSWQDMDKANLVAYIQLLRKKQYASSTVARKVAAVKSFFHFMLDQKLLEDDPTATLDSPKVKKRLPKILSPDDIEALRTADKFCERAERGLPPDRWATTQDMHKIARAITVLYAMAWANCSAAAQAQYEAGLRSIRMEGED